MTTVNLGRIKPIFQGTWSAATVYKPLDFVKYSNGATYFCILETTAGIVCTNATYWQKVADNVINDTAYGASWEAMVEEGISGHRLWDKFESIVGATYATLPEVIIGTEDSKAIAPDILLSSGVRANISNLKLVVNASVNKLDIFSRSGGAAPDTSNPISVAIPDGNGNVIRTRAAAYLSGTSQFIMADAANYWSKGSLDAEIKTAYVYAIWDANGGIVWALGGYSGFTRVPASTTATDDDFVLLEASSTYTKVITDYCVCVGKIRYQYDTADTPDHTIQATVLDAPQIMWNPKSDYSKVASLVDTLAQGSDIAEYSAVSYVVKQSGVYLVFGWTQGYSTGGTTLMNMLIKAGSSTYASAVLQIQGAGQNVAANSRVNISRGGIPVYLNAGETIHLGVACSGASGNRIIEGNSTYLRATGLSFARVD